MGSFCRCPRCGDRAFEKLTSYAHCAQCLYFEDYWVSPERDLIEAQNAVKEIEERIDQNNAEQSSTLVEFPSSCEIEDVGA
jgi:hypothetical protein